MAEKDRVKSSLRVWIATAWADGTIVDTERDALRRMIDYATMPEEYRVEARTWLDAPIELEVGDLGELPEERRLFIYRVAAALTEVDRQVDSTERRLLDRLRDALHIDAKIAVELERAVVTA